MKLITGKKYFSSYPFKTTSIINQLPSKIARMLLRPRMSGSTDRLLFTNDFDIFCRYYKINLFCITFTAEDTNVLKPCVFTTYLRETVLYPFPQENACDTLKNARCPLKSGQDVTYQLSMPILEYYQEFGIPASVEFAFLDDKDKVILCFAFSAKVVDQ
ncbi:uncharacterized protein LOC107981010 [Nasonia vitripennis]|uniref:MD-2-related lipid-recognition domain-containing protein n=1 Tax=Nasonia vitripennis TaxID=7425 RepID=A0A7M7QCD3_NASVI|nr:uncharacterized protein LOC107981010 [Nasonia vitripennis]